jgi:hypothetical protein
MALQQISGGFDSNPAGFCLVDALGAAAGTSAYMKGATVIDPIPLQTPPLGQRWTITAWSMRFNGIIGIANTPAYGRLGRIYGGLSKTPPTAQGSQPYVNPMLPIPNDWGSSIQLLWDGETDTPFPTSPNVTTTAGLTIGMISQDVVLSQPLPIDSGQPMSIGLWLTPGILNNTIIGLWSGRWLISYDDGEPINVGWGDR